MRYQAGTLTVEIDDATMYATVYDEADETPRGTIHRRRIDDRVSKRWQVYNLRGELIYQTNYNLFRIMLRALQ